MNPHQLLIPLLSAIASCQQQPLAESVEPPTQAKELFVRSILKLPEHSIYEESTDSFKQRLQKGLCWYDSHSDTVYLYIDGDGCFSKRLFSMNPKQGLRVLCRNRREDDQPDDVSLYQYDGKQLILISELPCEDMDKLLPSPTPIR